MFRVYLHKHIWLDEQWEWIIESLREVGIAVYVGALLSGVVGDFTIHMSIILFGIASALCYTSFILINLKYHN